LVKRLGELLGGITRSRQASIDRLGALESQFSAMTASDELFSHGTFRTARKYFLPAAPVRDLFLCRLAPNDLIGIFRDARESCWNVEQAGVKRPVGKRIDFDGHLNQRTWGGGRRGILAVLVY
jgi:hypothetical protein